MKSENNKIWTTENLVMFGMWLVNRGDYGYGLMCIHGSCTGIKIGQLLKLTWSDFVVNVKGDYVDLEADFPSKKEIVILSKKDGNRIVPISDFIKIYTRAVYDDLDLKTRDIEAPIYINTKTGKVLTTSSLNRELNKLYEQFRMEVFQLTYLKLTLRELKTNTLEIAWGRDMVQKYNCTKKAFIAVSKYMGHRTVNDTISILEIEPNDEIVFSYDMYNSDWVKVREINSMLTDRTEFTNYLRVNEIADSSWDTLNILNPKKLKLKGDITTEISSGEIQKEIDKFKNKIQGLT